LRFSIKEAQGHYHYDRQATVSGATNRVDHVGNSLAQALYDAAWEAHLPQEVLDRIEDAQHAGMRANVERRGSEAVQHYFAAWQIATEALPPATPTPAA
jgi:hypothetical protein